MFMVYNYNTKVPINNTTQHPNTVKCLREENPKSGKKKKSLFKSYNTKQIPLKIIVVVPLTYKPSKLCKIQCIRAPGSYLQLIIPILSPYCRHCILYPLQLEAPFSNDAEILRPKIGLGPNHITN